MAFVATLRGVEPPGEPTRIIIHVEYADDTRPNWSETRQIPILVNVGLSAAEQRAAIVNAVKADANLYWRQWQVYQGLVDLVGQSIPITGV